MSAELTTAQQTALQWITTRIGDGRLENPFMIVWVKGYPVGDLDYPGHKALDYPPEFTEENLTAIAGTGRLAEQRLPLRTVYTYFDNPLARRVPASSAAEPPAADAPPADAHERAVRLARFINAYYDREELENLCFDLGIDYHNLGGDKKETHARRLVAYMDTRGRLDELARKLAADRPEKYRLDLG